MLPIYIYIIFFCWSGPIYLVVDLITIVSQMSVTIKIYSYLLSTNYNNNDFEVKIITFILTYTKGSIDK